MAIKMSSSFTWAGDLLALQSAYVHGSCPPVPPHNPSAAEGRQIRCREEGPVSWEENACSCAESYRSVPEAQPALQRACTANVRAPTMTRAGFLLSLCFLLFFFNLKGKLVTPVTY